MPAHNPWYTPDLSSALRVGAATGKIIWVQEFTGDDNSDGRSPQSPKATIGSALGDCVADDNDTIVVLDYWDGSTGGEGFPISVDVTGVTIIGAKGGSYASYVAMTPIGATSIFDIAAGNVRLINLYLTGEATQAGITFTGGHQRIGIYGCLFATGTYGIQMQVGAPGATCEVAGCTFVQALSVGGILVANQAYLRIRDCVFEQPQGICIEVGAAGGVQILDNSLGIDSDVAGRAITLAAGANHCHIDGNRAIFGEDQAGDVNNPYLDNAAVDVNSWLLNHWGIVPTPPA